MKYIAIATIWLCYAAMVTAITYWVKDGSIIYIPIFFAGIFAVIATAIIANTK